MHVTVLFFGMLKDLIGRSQDDLELPEGARLETVFEHYASIPEATPDGRQYRAGAQSRVCRP